MRERGTEFRLVEFRDDLALGYLGIEIDINLADVARYLRTHFHLVNGFKRSCGRNRGGDGCERDLGAYKRACRCICLCVKKEFLYTECDSRKDCDDNNDLEQLFHTTDQK